MRDLNKPEDISFNINVKMRARWAPHFIGMLRYMQHLGGIGASRRVTFMSDGDGDFRPRFSYDIDIDSAGPIENENGNHFYDAG